MKDTSSLSNPCVHTIFTHLYVHTIFTQLLIRQIFHSKEIINGSIQKTRITPATGKINQNFINQFKVGHLLWVSIKKKARRFAHYHQIVLEPSIQLLEIS